MPVQVSLKAFFAAKQQLQIPGPSACPSVPRSKDGLAGAGSTAGARGDANVAKPATPCPQQQTTAPTQARSPQQPGPVACGQSQPETRRPCFSGDPSEIYRQSVGQQEPGDPPKPSTACSSRSCEVDEMLSWLEAEEPAATGAQAEAPTPSHKHQTEAADQTRGNQTGEGGAASSPSCEPRGTSTAQDDRNPDAGHRQQRVPPGEAVCPGISSPDAAKMERACSMWLCFAQRRDTTSAPPTRGRTGKKRRRAEQPQLPKPFGSKEALAASVPTAAASRATSSPPPYFPPQRAGLPPLAVRPRSAEAPLAAPSGAANSGAEEPTAVLKLLPGTRQMHIDLGQANFAYRRCHGCGLMYAAGNETDERVHADYHRRTLEGIKLKETRSARVIFHDHSTGGRVISVIKGDSLSLIKQVGSICAHVEQELGTQQGWLRGADSKAFLYVSSKQRVLGLVLMEVIRSARRVAPSCGREEEAAGGATSAAAGGGGGGSSSGNGNGGADEGGSGPGSSGAGEGGAGGRKAAEGSSTRSSEGGGGVGVESLAEGEAKRRGAAGEGRGNGGAGPPGILLAAAGPPVAAVCGVRAVWVAADSRRQRVASKLLDSARCECLVGYVVPREEVAFFHPTEAGQAFASRYTGTPSFLVYGC